MSVRLADGVIVLEGDCPVDEAEALLDLLLANAISYIPPSSRS
jgi:hypothetical protein